MAAKTFQVYTDTKLIKARANKLPSGELVVAITHATPSAISNKGGLEKVRAAATEIAKTLFN